MSKHKVTLSTALGIGLFLVSNAAAIEQDIVSGTTYLAVPPAAAPVTTPAPTFLGQPFDIALGVAFTSDYVSRGITNSAGHPAVQGYIEPSLGPLYFNVWASNVDFGAEEFEGAEIDTAVGLRHDIGPASLGRVLINR